MDSLATLLRDYAVQRKPITESDDEIFFGNVSYPKKHNTNFRVFSKDKSVNEYYTLECLTFFIKNVKVHHPKYTKMAAAANIQAVRRPDRNVIANYLSGAASSCIAIDENKTVAGTSTIQQEAANIQAVRQPDRNVIANNLSGAESSCIAIDKNKTVAGTSTIQQEWPSVEPQRTHPVFNRRAATVDFTKDYIPGNDQQFQMERL